MLLPVQLPPPFGPPLLVLLLGPGHGQRVRGHILGDGGTRRDIGTRAHSHRRHQIGVAADEGAVLNGAAVLLHAVIVGGDGAAAEVDLAAHVAVPHIGQVGDFGAVTDGGVLHLHKVAHLDVVPDGAAGAHVGKGPHVGAAADGALVHLGGIDLCLIADDAIPHHGIGTDGAAAADGGLPPQDGARQDDRARRDLYRVVDEDAVGGIKNNARGQVPLKRCLKCRPALPVCCYCFVLHGQTPPFLV